MGGRVSRWVGEWVGGSVGWWGSFRTWVSAATAATSSYLPATVV